MSNLTDKILSPIYDDLCYENWNKPLFIETSCDLLPESISQDKIKSFCLLWPEVNDLDMVKKLDKIIEINTLGVEKIISEMIDSTGVSISISLKEEISEYVLQNIVNLKLSGFGLKQKILNIWSKQILDNKLTISQQIQNIDWWVSGIIQIQDLMVKIKLAKDFLS